MVRRRCRPDLILKRMEKSSSSSSLGFMGGNLFVHFGGDTGGYANAGQGYDYYNDFTNDNIDGWYQQSDSTTNPITITASESASSTITHHRLSSQSNFLYHYTANTATDVELFSYLQVEHADVFNEAISSTSWEFRINTDLTSNTIGDNLIYFWQRGDGSSNTNPTWGGIGARMYPTRTRIYTGARGNSQINEADNPERVWVNKMSATTLRYRYQLSGGSATSWITLLINGSQDQEYFALRSIKVANGGVAEFHISELGLTQEGVQST